jgi:methionyl-tRNA formyltransferase
MSNQSIRFAFFGGEPLAVPTLSALKAAGIVPTLVVCNPDRPVGRKQVITPPPAKVWAYEHGISIYQPKNYKNKEDHTCLTEQVWDVFVVVAYNYILPTWVLHLPTHGVINVHPSLLPLLRGASPIRSAILADMRSTGVTIMQMDEAMDHGPILAQESITIPKDEWPTPGRVLDTKLAELGGTLLSTTLPRYLAGELSPIEQAHEHATYCSKLSRADGELTIDPFALPTSTDAYQALLKIRAFDGWPGTFFMYNGQRIIITEANISPTGNLHLITIVPEGKQEMPFDIWFRSERNRQSR